MQSNVSLSSLNLLALSNLWNSYMSSSQGVLGEKDPSSNSRQAISRPAKKLHRRSNVGELFLLRTRMIVTEMRSQRRIWPCDPPNLPKSFSLPFPVCLPTILYFAAYGLQMISYSEFEIGDKKIFQ